MVAKKKKNFGQAKFANEGLEGFVDLTNLTVSQSVEERETEMSGLVAGFAIRMRKRAANAQEGTTPSLKVPGDKHPRASISEDKVQDNPVVIAVDSLVQVLEASSAIGGAA